MTAIYFPPPDPVTPDLPQLTAWFDGDRLTGARQVTFRDEHNAFGSWSMSLLNTDADVGSLDFGDIVNIELDGVLEFVGKVEEIRQVTVGAGEEAEQATSFSGRSILAEWDWATVRPSQTFRTWGLGPLAGLELGAYPFNDTRYWNWASPGVSRTSWTAAVQLWKADQFPPLASPSGFDGAPEAWPDAAWWIAPRAIVSNAHPIGVWYAYKTITVDANTYDIDIFAACAPDDSMEVWLDGQPVIVSDHNEESGTKTCRARVGVSPGTKTLVAKITHLYAGSGDVTGFICSVYKHKATDLRGDGAGYLVSPLTTTSTSWKCSDYPSTQPGYTPGGVIEEAFHEARSRGVAGVFKWSIGFNDTGDSVAQAWADPVEISSPIGKSLSELMRAVGETYFYFRYDPTTNDGRHLDIFKYPVGFASSGVTFTPGVNCLALSGHGTDDISNDLITRWRDGTSRTHDDTSITAYGIREAYLSAPDIADGTVAFAALSALAYLAVPTESVELEFLPAFANPKIDETVAYTDRHGAVVTGTIVARTVAAYDDDGNARITIEVGSSRDDLESRADRYNRTAAHGTLDGRSESAVPSNASIISSQQISPVVISLNTGGGTTIVGDRASTQRPSEAMVVCRIEADCDIAGTSGSTTVRVEKDGASIGTVTIASGATTGHTTLGTPVLFKRSNYANLETTAAGGHVGISVTLAGIPVR